MAVDVVMVVATAVDVVMVVATAVVVVRVWCGCSCDWLLI